jgi:hypothetical protein
MKLMDRTTIILQCYKSVGNLFLPSSLHCNCCLQHDKLFPKRCYVTTYLQYEDFGPTDESAGTHIICAIVNPD